MLAVADPGSRIIFFKLRTALPSEQIKPSFRPADPILSQPGKLLYIYPRARSFPNGLLELSLTSRWQQSLSHLCKIQTLLIVPFCYHAQPTTWILAKIIKENYKQISVPLLTSSIDSIQTHTVNLLYATALWLELQHLLYLVCGPCDLIVHMVYWDGRAVH